MAKGHEGRRQGADRREPQGAARLLHRGAFRSRHGADGLEVKSLRAGRAQLTEAYVFIRAGEIFLFGAHLSPLVSASTHVIADPIRTRKLLLNRAEIDKLVGAVEREGYTIVPLELYWNQAATRRCASAWPRARSSTTSAPPRRTATGSATRPASCAHAERKPLQNASLWCGRHGARPQWCIAKYVSRDHLLQRQ